MRRPLHPVDFEEIAHTMCGIQKKALLALTFDETPEPTLLRLREMHPFGIAFERDGDLVAIAGAVITHPGVASTFLYSSDLSKIVLEVSHYFRSTLFPLLKRKGCHRVHSMGPANDPAGRRWKEDVLGAWPEAHLEKYGKNGEDFVLHAVML